MGKAVILAWNLFACLVTFAVMLVYAVAKVFLIILILSFVKAVEVFVTLVLLLQIETQSFEIVTWSGRIFIGRLVRAYDFEFYGIEVK